MPPEEGSVTHWIGDLRGGNHQAAQPLWERYFERLVRLARAKLRGNGRSRAVADEEDAALSAFDSFCTGAVRGRFPQMEDRDDLWRVLVVITARKALDQVQHHGRQKRGGGRVLGQADLRGSDDATGAGALEQIVGTDPTPEFAATVAEEFRRLLDALGDDSLRQVALRKMEGYTGKEIAESLGCSLRTVANKLELIRQTWLVETRR